MSTKAERRIKKRLARERRQALRFYRRGHYLRFAKWVIDRMPPLGEGPIARRIQERYGDLREGMCFPMGTPEEDAD